MWFCHCCVSEMKVVVGGMLISSHGGNGNSGMMLKHKALRWDETKDEY